MVINKNTPENPLPPNYQSGKNRYVIVVLSPFKSNEIRNFRCINCSKIVFQYKSDISTIIDSQEIPKSSMPVDIICHKCKILYRIVW